MRGGKCGWQTYTKFMKFMHLKYPSILKQRFSTFGTVITIADNEQDHVEIDSDYIYTCINIYMTNYIYMTYVDMYTYTYTYVHTFIYVYIYSINIYSQVTWSCICLYTLILTITIKDTFLYTLILTIIIKDTVL